MLLPGETHAGNGSSIAPPRFILNSPLTEAAGDPFPGLGLEPCLRNVAQLVELARKYRLSA
jgi:hypothetical protein